MNPAMRCLAPLIASLALLGQPLPADAAPPPVPRADCAPGATCGPPAPPPADRASATQEQVNVEPVIPTADRSRGSGWGIVFVAVVVIGGLLSLAFYFVPTIVAFAARRRQAWLIALLNLLLGWTMTGWLAALIWALVSDRPEAAT